jgi:hypothetical protein
MADLLDEDDKAKLAESIRLTLRGDKPENKLLGLQFGGA